MMSASCPSSLETTALMMKNGQVDVQLFFSLKGTP